ncbi:MAG: cytochrome C, partial [Desulfuromonadales bacterium]|nr:cytochrome C [Desulfuromonadales bacterium]NIS42776.1 cytochrome C [Desulfuromonadales bacterium]
MKAIKITLTLLAMVGLMVTSALAGHQDRIEGPVKEPQDITRQCLQCHEDAAKDFMKTSHWNWSLEQEVNGKEVDRG